MVSDTLRGQLCDFVFLGWTVGELIVCLLLLLAGHQRIG